MKVAAIPAQITTVEDRIAGNLNLTQLLLLSASLFLTAFMFFLFPPLGIFSAYKIISALFFSGILAMLAIRIKDKLVIDLIKLRASFELRPRTYVYRKQQLPLDLDNLVQTKTPKYLPSRASFKSSIVTQKARVNSHKLLMDDKYRVAFQARKGGLIVKVSTLE